ncbi:hypothetical protein ABEB22_14285 (plasmid) [Thioclava sp. 'Guangxiensis']|uniref:hypothetical protein n=1 Tax=Thioclava sp. 'Guangxiensis' TaxID=3149044 RepID=UPI0032C48910
MKISTNDSSYRFVREANRKEALNKERRRARNPRPWWSVFAACLMAGLTVMYVHDGNTELAILFAFSTVLNCFYAYIGWKKRRSLSCPCQSA